MTRTLLTTIVLVSAALAFAGCRSAAETTESNGRRQFTHFGMHFSLEVPEDWSVEALEGSVAAELRGPAIAERRRAVVHVFTRREAGAISLSDTVEQVAALIQEDLRFQLEENPGPPVAESATLANRPAKVIRRVVHEGPLEIDQELWMIAEGRQVWALVLSVAAAQKESASAAFELVRSSFKVW